MKEITSTKCCEGFQKRFQHFSPTLHCDMHFSVFMPPQMLDGNKVPVLYWLSGLTCTDENFSTKSGAQKIAAQLGIMLVIPDTSPRGNNVPDDESAAYDFGLGAGFYINATQEPWSANYQMYDYIVKELPHLIENNFAVTNKKAISGHSMGGHGALVIALRNPNSYTSVSAFSPIVNPMNVPWGIKAFSNYLGKDKKDWQMYDATWLIQNQNISKDFKVRIDQGLADQFLAEQLQTQNFEEACRRMQINTDIHLHAGYDHSYYFIASFIDEHLKFHSKFLYS